MTAFSVIAAASHDMARLVGCTPKSSISRAIATSQGTLRSVPGRTLLLLGVAACVLFAARPAEAVFIEPYNIAVEVTSAPNPMGNDVNYSFGTLPETFTGTFMADPNNTGDISDLVLTIGGVGVTATFGDVEKATFNPTTLALDFQAFSGDQGTTAHIDFLTNGTARGLDDNNAQFQWSRTYTVTAIPEPSVWPLWAAGAAIFGCFGRRARRR